MHLTKVNQMDKKTLPKYKLLVDLFTTVGLVVDDLINSFK